MSFLDTSVGIGQVKISTAKEIPKRGYIEKSKKKWTFTAFGIKKNFLSLQLLDNKTNIRYTAAYIRLQQDMWMPTLDVSNNPGVLATLYNLGKNANNPNQNPKANPFGQYVEDNYDMLKQLLGL